MVTPSWEHLPGAAPRLVHVSAAARGGEVATLLGDLVPAQAATGLSVGWAVLGGDDRFFTFLRYLHQLLHGRADTPALELLAESVPHYREVLDAQAEWLGAQLDRGDVVVLHDAQTVGMAPALAQAGLKVVLHCHAGTTDADASGPYAVWHAFGREVSSVDATLGLLPEFAPQAVPLAHRHVVAPAVDANAARNRPLTRTDVTALLADLGLTNGSGTVEQDLPLPAGAPVVLQLGRWEPLMDMPGVLRSAALLPPDVHVVLAGDEPADPDTQAVLDEVREARDELSPGDRARVHLALLSTQDPERAALTANALQRRADVVLQKSLAEGFGLTVTDAMVKGRAVVAADVGGLRHQISPGHNGLLTNPWDSGEVTDAVRTLLDDPLLARRLGKHAAESVRRRYLMPRLVADYELLAAPALPQRARDAA